MSHQPKQLVRWYWRCQVITFVVLFSYDFFLSNDFKYQQNSKVSLSYTSSLFCSNLKTQKSNWRSNKYHNTSIKNQSQGYIEACFNLLLCNRIRFSVSQNLIIKVTIECILYHITMYRQIMLGLLYQWYKLSLIS